MTGDGSSSNPSPPPSPVPEQGSSSRRAPYGVPQGGVPPLFPEVETVDLGGMPDTSNDKDIARKLFIELNWDLMGIPGDGGLVIIPDSDDEEMEVEPSYAYPQRTDPDDDVEYIDDASTAGP